MPADHPAAFLNRHRLVAWAAILLTIETAIFILLVLQQNNILFHVGPASIDFVSFYAAGKLVLAGTPELAYDQAAHYLAQGAATEPGRPYVFFFYPPPFLLICAALALLPYPLALAVFELASLAFLIAVLRRILRLDGWAWLIPVLAFPATFWNAGQGQNAFLTAGLFGLFGLWLDRRPFAAGGAIGALCFKPHLGLLAPVALAAAGRWTAFAGAAAVALAIAGLSILLLGPATLAAYLRAMAGADAIYASGRINFAGFASIFGALRLAHTPTVIAYAIQGATTLACAIAAFAVWRRASAGAARASLPALTLLAVPLALLYDQMLGVVAISFIIGDPDQPPLTTGERLALIAAYPIALVAPIVAIGSPVPMAFLASIIVAAICLRRGLATTPATSPRPR